MKEQDKIKDFAVIAFDTQLGRIVIVDFHEHYAGAEHIATCSQGIDLPMKNGSPDWSGQGRYENSQVYQKYDSIRE